MRLILKFLLVSFSIFLGFRAYAQSYQPPTLSLPFLSNANMGQAVELNDVYKKQFMGCDGSLSPELRNKFNGHSLVLANKPDSKQYYLCSRDPSNLKALLKLSNGGIYWHSKMALDVDGSAASWDEVRGATDLKFTSYRWRNVANKESRAAQVDPDKFPYIVIPTSGIRPLTGNAATALGAEFKNLTGLREGDFAVVIYKNKWTPAFIADGGPFMRIGEASSRVFENIGETRCRRWNEAKDQCIGLSPTSYPYRNFGLSRDVIYIAFPNSHRDDMTPQNAQAMMCEVAKQKLGLTGGVCPQ